MENLDALKGILEELESNAMNEWNSLFEDKEEEDSKDEEKKEKEEDSKDDDSKEESSEEPSEDDSILNDMEPADVASSEESSDSEEPPVVDADTSAENSLDELAEKIHLSKNEVSILDAMIDSETDAISDYSKGLNEAKNKYVRKLLTEILTDESKHLAQLKYLKSLGTEGDYVPKDQDAIDELQDTLESIIEELL